MGDISLDVKVAALTAIAKTGAVATTKIGKGISDRLIGCDARISAGSRQESYADNDRHGVT